MKNSNSKKFFERNALKGIFGFWVKPFKNIFLILFCCETFIFRNQSYQNHHKFGFLAEFEPLGE